jgi:hypothetical protein
MCRGRKGGERRRSWRGPFVQDVGLKEITNINRDNGYTGNDIGDGHGDDFSRQKLSHRMPELSSDDVRERGALI